MSLAHIAYTLDNLTASVAPRMAERVGFEPTVPFPGRVLSKHVDSATLAPLHGIFLAILRRAAS